jgi:hypothetical protein
MKLQLIPEWKVIWKFWSTNLVALIGLVHVVPAEALLSINSMIPPDLQQLLPGRNKIILILVILAILAKLVKQKSVEKVREEVRAKEQSNDAA